MPDDLLGGVFGQIRSALEDWVERKDYVRSVGCAELSESIGVIPQQLQAYCRYVFHMSYKVWRPHLRMEEARRMLDERPDLLVKQVSAEVGIYDLGNFCSTFKEIYGVTPVEWRQGLRRHSEMSVF